MTEVLVIVISILLLGVCLSSTWILYDIYKKLKSIEVDLICIETRQRNMLSKQDYMHTSIYYVSSQLEDIVEKLTNENKEK